MNPNLVGILRERMKPRGNDELMKLWVENNRQQWSPECFEAARLLLAERGVALPPQGAPPVPVQTLPRSLDPASQYWFAWLKPVLWVGVILAVSGAAAAAPGLFWVAQTGTAIFAQMSFWGGGLLVVALVLKVALSLALFVGAVGSLRHPTPLFRRLLVVYGWCFLALGLLMLANNLYRQLSWGLIRLVGLYSPLETLDVMVHQLVFPAALLWVLGRPPIRELFSGAAANARGFEPTLSPVLLPNDAAPLAR